MKESIPCCSMFFLLCVISMTTARYSEYPKFVLGGLFPIHEMGDHPHSCGAIMKEKGIQRMEAMLYAIKEINKNPRFWRFTLEAKILDTCSSDAHALKESLKFLTVSCEANKTGQMVTGVIGAANSPVSEAVATIFRLFQIPQISYASTSTALDDVHKYPYFFRVVPSDKYQVAAIVDILHKFNWTYLSTVAAEGHYGEKAVMDLQKVVREKDICFDKNVIIPRNAKNEDYKAAVKQLREDKRAKAVVVFLNEDQLKNLFKAAKEMGVENGDFLWLGSDSWGAKKQVVKGFEAVVEGGITLLPMQHSVLADFDDYFTSLNPNNHEDDWFTEYWESEFHCHPVRFAASGGTHCSDKDLKTTNYTQEGLVPMVIDAVNVMAHALKKMCATESMLCENTHDPPPGETLKRYIEEVVINSSRGNDMIIRFDENRSVPVNYTIYQFRKVSTDIYKYIPIGSWGEKGLNVLDYDGLNIDESTCGVPCKPGWEREYTNTKKKCCWKCKRCPDNEYVPSPTSSCTPCKEGDVLNKAKTTCVTENPEYFGMDMGSPWAAVPFVFAILGLISTVVMYIGFLVYHNTPIIMASGRELCHLIFLGVLLCYCYTFVMVSQPTPFVCGLVRVGLGLGMAICYSAIFTKTNRISRIFNRTVRHAKRPRYVTPKSQLVICLSLVMIELALSAIWLLLEPPTVGKKQPNKAKPMVETCEIHDETVCVALAFSVALIAMCTYYAYKTRKIPENFNEAKYISFVMYSTCIIWMAFVPTYFSVSSDYKVRNTLLSMSISMSGTVALVCIFGPKLYIVIFQPQKNVRYPTTTNSATPAYSAPMRYVKTSTAANTLPPPEVEVPSEGKNSRKKKMSAPEPATMDSLDDLESRTWKERKVSHV